MALGSFSAGLSGLNANSLYLNVIGNNLANINTVGYKASAVSFMDLVSQTVGGSSSAPMQVGLGVVTGSIAPVLSQGAIEDTRESTNVAIQGNGFFVVSGPNDEVNYTRAGNFTLDRDGRLVTQDGYSVQGYTEVDPLTNEIITAGELSDIIIPPGVLRAPLATSTFRTQTNLDADAQLGDTFTTAVQVYDALGSAHVATITYTKGAAAGAWAYDITVPGDEITGGVAGTPFSVGTGTAVFDGTGTLTTLNGAAPADVAIVTPAWLNGAAASAWSWDVVDDNLDASLTGFASPSTTAAISQNGTSPGMTESISVSSDGSIYATFGAGQVVALGQLALANFNNPKALFKLGSNRFGATEEAGVPNVGVPGTGARGAIIGSALEQSNVDIAHEFTQMILAQRGYQANSKTITVSDELMLETLNLKR
ncbi:MAG: flagellar hook protein FlgE [Vicinamibacterales bacterium]